MVAVSKSIQTSTVVMGVAEVLFVGVQEAMTLRLMTRCPYSLRLDGLMEMILATRIFIVASKLVSNPPTY